MFYRILTSLYNVEIFFESKLKIFIERRPVCGRPRRSVAPTPMILRFKTDVNRSRMLTSLFKKRLEHKIIDEDSNKNFELFNFSKRLLFCDSS